MSDSGVD